MVVLNIEQLSAIFPTTPIAQLQKYINPINDTIGKYGLRNAADVAAFLAQTGHECMEFKVFEENLNYSAQGLLRVFPKYFNQTTAAQYARNPMEIANRVYANRMGNGPENSGDGWRFRGRGAIQLTGKNNYMAFARDHNTSVEDAITWLGEPSGHLASAGWFWKTNRLSQFAVDGHIGDTEFEQMTVRINGGKNGLAHRREIWQRAKQQLGVK